MVFGVSVFSCRGERTKIVALLLLRIAEPWAKGSHACLRIRKAPSGGVVYY